MSLEISIPTEESSLQPNIVVIGVGGAGGNAINNMIESSLEGVHFIATNTDAQALEHSSAPIRIQLGANITKGLGAGAKPHIGRAAAEETLDEITQHIEKAHMVFIAAGMGGGTGTGASSVIARASKERGILTIGVVTKPFHFEGKPRMRIAEEGIIELEPFVDTLLVIPNQNLFRLANEKTTFSDAFKMADNVLYSGVRGITDLMLMPGLINLDFADVRTIMSEMGTAMMGTGESSGDNRALSAAQIAISNPLLDDVSLKGAKGVLINVTGGDDMTLFEVDQAAGYIREQVDDNANIIFGSTFDTKITGSIRVSIVATGIENGKRYTSPATHHGSAHNNSVDQEKPCKTTLSKNSTRSENINDMDSLFFSVKQRLEEATRILRETKTETLDSQEVILNQEKNITTTHESNPIDPIDLTSSPETTQETQQDLFSVIHHPASSKGSPTKDLLDIPAFLRRKGRS